MLKKLLITTALSGLMLSSALAQSPSPSSPSSSPSSSSDAMKSDTSKSTTSGASSGSSASATITSQKPDQMLVSNLKGVDVMGSDDKKIGDISDILVSKDGKVEAYLISVGGFLGVGAKEIALPPSAIQLSEENNSWKAKVSSSKDQLAQAPNFERPSRSTTGASSSSSGSGMGSSGSSPRNAPSGGGGSAPASRP
jgi:sporulation protein YlmC with PRC-barrel domain